MKAIDVIRVSLEQSKGWILGLLTDMKDAPLTVPTTAGGNHPLWIAGHLAFSEAELVAEFIEGKPNPLEDWRPVFGMGSQPVADASRYPSFDEVMASLEESRARTLQLLDSLSDEDLDKPTHVPEEAKEFFGTVGQCLTGIAIHFTFHGGQVADARRAAGRDQPMG